MDDKPLIGTPMVTGILILGAMIAAAAIAYKYYAKQSALNSGGAGKKISVPVEFPVRKK